MTWHIGNSETHQELFRIEQSLPIPLEFSPERNQIAFYRTEFVTMENEPKGNSLILLNQNGEMLDMLYYQDESWFSSITFGWSRDGRYYAFMPIEERESRTGTLHLADMQDQTVINTCISTMNFGLAWSPTENKLVISYPEYGLQPLQILDLDLWQAYYTNQYHNLNTGSIMGWRAD